VTLDRARIANGGLIAVTGEDGVRSRIRQPIQHELSDRSVLFTGMPERSIITSRGSRARVL